MSDQPMAAGDHSSEAEKAGRQGVSPEQNSYTVQYRRGLFRGRKFMHVDSHL